MGNRTAKFISAVFASVLAGAPFAAMSQDAPSAPKAADDCLASPKGAAPQGQHWYYRLERGTKRQCWYLREEGPKAAQGTQQSAAQNTPQSAQAATPAPVASPPASPRAVQDAHAEWTSQQPALTQTAPIQPAPTRAAPPIQDTTASLQAQSATAPARSSAAPDASAQPPAVASRWPDAPAAGPSSAPQAAPTVADAAPTPQAAASPSPAQPAPAAADVPVGKPTASLQTLLLVIGGALTLAGITGSLIYRFAGSRVRVRVPANEGVRRRVNWDNWERELEEARAPWLETPRPVASSTPRPRPVDFGFALHRESKPASTASHADPEGTEADDGEATTAWSDTTELPFDIDQAEAHLQDEAIDAHAEDADAEADAVDIDAITAILERLAKEGPRLGQPSPATGPAASVQSRQDRSDVRA